MTAIGTPLSPSATRVLFCDGGELGIKTSAYQFAGTRGETTSTDLTAS